MTLLLGPRMSSASQGVLDADGRDCTEDKKKENGSQGTCVNRPIRVRTESRKRE